MKFNSYPDPIKGYLQQARLDVLDKMVALANEEKCNIFVIAGDLFDRITGVDKKTKERVISAFEKFHGECVLILPGNHDYDNGMVDLWESYSKTLINDNKIILLSQEKPYYLRDYGLNIAIYPAPCHSKHSSINGLQWIKDINGYIDSDYINIGVAHGALEGVSPDLDEKYYNMSIRELEETRMDLWLLGHTHILYPFKTPISNEKIFNPGTPEPDGLDCKHEGRAWIIAIDDSKKTTAYTVETGTYRFVDRLYTADNRDDLDRILEDIKNVKPEKTIARITLNGSVDEDTFDYRQEIYRAIEKNIAYLIVDDSDFKIKITTEKIYKEFLDGSFPQELLLSLADDEDTLQLAYKLIMEVKE